MYYFPFSVLCVNVWCTAATGCQSNVWFTAATGCQPNVWCTAATGCQPNCRYIYIISNQGWFGKKLRSGLHTDEELPWVISGLRHCVRSSLFWNVTQCRLVVSYRTAWILKMGPTGFPEKPVTNYKSALRKSRISLLTKLCSKSAVVRMQYQCNALFVYLLKIRKCLERNILYFRIKCGRAPSLLSVIKMYILLGWETRRPVSPQFAPPCGPIKKNSQVHSNREIVIM
jgi:hypothetical protein